MGNPPTKHYSSSKSKNPTVLDTNNNYTLKAESSFIDNNPN